MRRRSPPLRSATKETLATEGTQEGEGLGWGLYIIHSQDVRDPTPAPPLKEGKGSGCAWYFTITTILWTFSGGLITCHY